MTLAYYIIDLLMYNSNITSYLEFDDMNDNLCNVYADSISIFVKLKRKLDQYENNYINCNVIKNGFTKMEIPRINNVTIPKFGNLIMQISRNADFKKGTLKKFTNLYSNNACEEIMENSYQLVYCPKWGLPLEQLLMNYKL